MRRPFITSLILFTIFFVSSCSSVPSSSISEISFRNGGGQLVHWYQIVLRRDGTAEYTGDVSPERRRESRPSGNVRAEATQRVKYRGKVTQAQFEQLAKVVEENGFFSLKETYGGVSGAPQTTTTIVNSAGRKEVHNQLEQGGKGLSEIERAIDRLADQIAWEREEH
jgi:hypothetical protein